MTDITRRIPVCDDERGEHGERGERGERGRRGRTGPIGPTGPTGRVQILPFDSVTGGGGSVTLPHGLLQTPDFVAADSPGFSVTATATDVTVTNYNGFTTGVTVWLELKSLVPPVFPPPGPPFPPFVATAGLGLHPTQTIFTTASEAIYLSGPPGPSVTVVNPNHDNCDYYKLIDPQGGKLGQINFEFWMIQTGTAVNKPTWDLFVQSDDDDFPTGIGSIDGFDESTDDPQVVRGWFKFQYDNPAQIRVSAAMKLEKGSDTRIHLITPYILVGNAEGTSFSAFIDFVGYDVDYVGSGAMYQTVIAPPIL